MDVVRGLAALLVVVSHARLYIFSAAGVQLDEAPTWLRIALAPTAFGKEAVGVFFVLSGFLVGGQVIRLVRADKFDVVDYGVKRLSRLWSVLIPGLLFTIVIDLMMRIVSGKLASFSLIEGTDSLQTASCNAVFLMPTRCSTFGTNDSLWSLGYEFWFYIFFAAVAAGVGLLARRRWLAGSIALVVGLLSVVVFGMELLALIPAWLLGVGVAVIVGNRSGKLHSKRGASILGGLILAIACMLAPNLLHVTEPIKFLIVGAGAAALVLVLALRDPSPGAGLRLFRFVAWIGTWSFSIYVFHLPMVKLIAMLLPDGLGGVALLIAIYGTAVVVVAASYPLYLVSEKRMAVWRSVLFRAVGRRQRITPVSVER
ncbi:hypothetical protein ASF51_01750 [Agreia sp. Leaf283]|nr:hypothetical protein ASF51_01750 [Agreia sp. Leaf283]